MKRDFKRWRGGKIKGCYTHMVNCDGVHLQITWHVNSASIKKKKKKDGYFPREKQANLQSRKEPESCSSRRKRGRTAKKMKGKEFS